MHTDSKKEMKHRCSIKQKAYLICSLNVQFNDKKMSDVYKIGLQICFICKQHEKLKSENWSSVSLLLGKEQSVQLGVPCYEGGQSWVTTYTRQIYKPEIKPP